MKEDPQFVDRLVREVIARLAAAGVQIGPQVQVGRDAKEEKKDAGTVVIAERVVTWALIEKQLGGAKRVQVGERAVVTPAVKDELKQRGVELVRGEQATKATKGTEGKEGSKEGKDGGAAGFFVAACDTNFDSDAALAMVRGQRGERIQGGELAATMTLLTSAILGAKRPGVLLSGAPAAALCLANRNYGIRAILAGDVRRVESDAAVIGANLLIVDPSAKSPWEIANAVRAFVRGGWRECSEALRKTLGGV